MQPPEDRAGTRPARAGPARAAPRPRSHRSTVPADVRRHRLPARGRPRLACAAAPLGRRPRPRAAHRAVPGRARRAPAAAATGALRVDPPARTRARQPHRPRRRGGRRGRPPARRPARPRREPPLPRRPLPHGHAPRARRSWPRRAHGLRPLCASQLLACVPASFRAYEGWLSSLPLGLDRLRLRRTFDSDALAASFPFALAEPPLAEDGCFYGLAPSGAPVVFDRFAADNYNSVVLARSGAGKSYLAKLEALRLLYRGVQVFIVDPEDEYRRLCEAVGGAYLPLAGPRAVTLNPLDHAAGRLAPTRSPSGSPSSPSSSSCSPAALDGRRARRARPRRPRRLPPAAGRDRGAAPARSRPRAATSRRRGGPGARRAVRARSRPGRSPASSRRRRASGPTGELVCFSLRGLPERLKPAALLLCLDDDLAQRSSEPSRRRCVLVDEAWLVMREPAGARFLHRLAKSARKRWCGLTTITQDAGDLLATELGQAIVANAASQVLLRQAPQAIDRVAEAFRLTEGEARYLLTLPRAATASSSSATNASRSGPREPGRARLGDERSRRARRGGRVSALVSTAGCPPAAAGARDRSRARRPTSRRRARRRSPTSRPPTSRSTSRQGSRSGSPGSSSPRIGKVETDHGRNPATDVPNSAGAVGPMQFEPATFAEYSWASGRPEPEHPRPARRDLRRGGDARRERRPRRHRAGALRLQPRRLVRRARSSPGPRPTRTPPPSVRAAPPRRTPRPPP